MLSRSMTPGKFIAFQERRLMRSLSIHEIECLNAARYGCTGGKRETVKAMWAAMATCVPIAPSQPSVVRACTIP